MSRRDRLARWWHAARSTRIVALWIARGWVALGILGAFTGLKNSIAVLFFISCVTAADSAYGRAAVAKAEMREEEADAQRP